MEQTSLSLSHAIVLGELNFFNNKLERQLKCVYIIDGVYIGATNDFKRRVIEYIGRAKRNEKQGRETPIMAYIKARLSAGHKIKFCILSDNPCKEGVFI